MSIINKGILNSGSAYLRQVGNDWPTAQVVTTTEVIEGTNQYFTNTRVLQAVEPKLTTANVTEVTNQYFTNTRVLLALIGSNVSVNDLTVAGDLIVQGNTVTLNTGILTVEDKNISLANGAVNAAAADGAGFFIQGADANLTYLASGDKFVLNKNLDVTGNAVITGDVVATGNLVANGLIIRGIFVLDNILTGNITSAATTSANITADRITANTWINLYSGNVVETTNLYFTNTRVLQAVEPKLTTANVTEVTNQYFTNARARTAFTAGRGILISDAGVLQSTISQTEFSTTIDNSADYIVTDTLQPALTFPYVSSNVKYILRSIHVTNISNDTAFITSNVLYSNGNTAYLSYMMPVPTGAVLEFMDRVQLMQANDIINIQGFNASQTPQTGLLSANFTYESIADGFTYRGQGMVLPYSNNFIKVADFTESDALLESIKFINHKNYTIPISLYRGYANGQIRSHLAYNFEIPKNSSVEILQKPKFLKINDGLYAKYINSSNADSISVFTSYKYSAVTSIVSATSSTSVGGNATITFATSYPDGTTLYYSLD